MADIFISNSRKDFVDDYSTTGDTRDVFRRHITETLGHGPENVMTLTLVSTPAAASTKPPTDVHGVVESAEIVDLFYMYRR